MRNIRSGAWIRKNIHLCCSILFLFYNNLCFATNATSLTIYSSVNPNNSSSDQYRSFASDSNRYNLNLPGFAIVRIQKEVDIEEGKNRISLTDVADLIDPTTVLFKSITDPIQTSVLEQTYQYDLENQQKLLEKFLGQEITVQQGSTDQNQSFTGKLISFGGASTRAVSEAMNLGELILQDKEGRLIALKQYSNIRFPVLAEGLITKPIITWEILAKKLGMHQIEASYQTKGITWWADYNAVFENGKEANKGFLDLNAWVSIVNKSGANFQNVDLKLIAGDVNRVERRAEPMVAMATVQARGNMGQSGFSEKPFSEYHLYTLGRTISLPNNAIKQIELFPKASRIPVEKQYVFVGNEQIYYGAVNYNEDRSEINKKVEVFLKFKNGVKEGLGLPFPSGRIRVSTLDKNTNSLEFIGEDILNHTPKDENIRLKLGSAFDVIGERKVKNLSIDRNRHVMEEKIEIVIKNHQDQDVQIIIRENMHRTENWKILTSSSEYAKINASTVEFPVFVKKGGEYKVEYTVSYTWF